MPLAMPAWRRTREPRAAMISSPSPTGRMLTSSPGRSPAARSARTGIVTWFLEDTRAITCTLAPREVKATPDGSCKLDTLKGFALCHGLLHVDGFRSRLEDVYRTRYVAFCLVVMPIVGDP